MNAVTAQIRRTGRPSSTSTDSRLAGVGLMARLVLRSNRWFYLVWLAVLLVTLSGTASAYRATVPEGAAGRALAESLSANATMRALLGPPYDLLHVGPFVMWRVGTFAAAMAAIAAILGVIRASREQEEDGRTELLRSAAIGRHSPLVASLTVAWGFAALFGALSAAVLYRAQPEVPGALALGAGMTLTATMFAGVGAVAAQLHSSARSARFTAFGVLGASYLIRTLADGDGSPDDSGLRALQWVSPSEWAALARPYAGERVWVLALPLVASAGLAWAAVVLEARRDYGAGLRADPPGPARAGAGLGSARGLGRRLQRGSVIGWAVGLGVFALVAGFLATQFTSMINEQSDPDLAEKFRRMGGGASALGDAFIVAMLGIVGALVAVAALQFFSRLRREEECGHAEAMLATATTRTTYALSHLTPAALGATAILALFAVVMALPSVAGGGGIELIGTYVGAALAQAPGVWLVIGLAMTVHGLAPRLSILPWLLVGWTLFANWVGALLNLPQKVLDATPFAALPKLPAYPMEWTPWLVETAIAVALAAIGLWGYRRRDLTGRV